VAGYSALDRLLHRLALDALPIAEASFDLDQITLRGAAEDTAAGRHVFVCGLARAGTTVLMRRFHATGAYCSLTYRHMPFVLAPRLWGRLARGSRRTLPATERAHGDGILVDADSPESLDEVFWRVFDGERYIARTHLKPHAPDAETARKYVANVAAILSTTATPGMRYLSKNNNNVLRLETIRRLFPHALILVPFRHPLTHAASLLRQHRRFLEAQRDDAFIRSYMTWLAHHEFGGDHRPFRFEPGDARKLASFGSGEIDYWLEVWRQTYGWLERVAPERVTFVCYEDLCEREETLAGLLALAGVDGEAGHGERLRLSPTAVGNPRDRALAEEAVDLYARLVQRARAHLPSHATGV